MKKILWLFLCFFIILNFAESKTTEHFEKRFKIIRKSGEVVCVLDTSISNHFSLKKYVSYIKDKIKNEQDIMQASFDYGISVRTLFAEDQYLHNSYNEHSQNIEDLIKSLRKLPEINLSKVFKDPTFVEVINKFEAKLGSVLAQIDPRVLARPQDPTFYYSKKKTYKVLLWGLYLAKKKLSSIPLLNTASYLMVEVEKMVRTRREFHQNMLLYYLDNFKEEELGLTWSEANKIYSSIYESRIPWYAFWESTKAKLNWENYGTTSFFIGVRNANTRLRNFQKRYSTIGKRRTFSFQEVTFEGENLIINLVDNEGMFHRNPAVSFSRNDPKKIGRKRLLLQLGALGVSFLPIPSFWKDNIYSGFETYSSKQMITEGSLYGYIESMGEDEDLDHLKYQYLNPFETL